jgi:hypothetical protein
VKVGYTAGPKKRLDSLKTGSPHALQLLGVIPGDRAMETLLHREFAAHRMSGEWFRWVPEVESAVRRYLAAHSLPVAPDSPAGLNKLIAQEPRLLKLYERALSFHRATDPRFCANEVWYGYSDVRTGLKERLCMLVGWEARKLTLRTEEAYDVAYDAIYEALPDCRACGCL